MKTTAILLLALAPLCAMAQKEQKPSLSKAQRALFDGKLDVAKEIIDVTVASNDFMVDKKGKPTKNAAAAWYARGLIYAAIDTTSQPAFKALDPHPYATSIESFANCYKIDSTNGSFIKDPKDAEGFKPLTTMQIDAQLGRWYIGTAINKLYKTDKNYKAAFEYGERALHFAPKDTLYLYLVGVHLAPQAEEYKKSLMYMEKYIKAGGTSQDAWVQMMYVYEDKLKDNASALKVVKEAMAKFPQNEEFPKHELNLYLSDNNFDMAQKVVKGELRKNPNDPENFYRLGQLDQKLNKPDSALLAMQKAISLNSDFYEANLWLAEYYYGLGRAINDERDKLQMTDKNKDKRLKLINELREKYKISLPYWEKCEKLKPEEERVLFHLSLIYQSLVMDDQLARVQKRMKELGYDK